MKQITSNTSINNSILKKALLSKDPKLFLNNLKHTK